MSIQTAIQMNNQVVSLLDSKLFNDAILHSYAAMEMFQQHQHTADQVSLERESDNSTIAQFILDHHSTKRSLDEKMDEFIYEQGIVLPANAMDPSVITPVLIFNCALSHQMGGIHCKDVAASHTYLHRANKMYRLAYNQQDQDMNSAIFQFAILNNIGIVHKKLGNREESKKFFEHLVCVDAGMESKQLQHVSGIWKNVLGDGSKAPAA